jgi:hypothetical protein
MMICLLTVTLTQGMALPDRASGEAKQKPGVIKEEEPAAPSEIQVIRRVSVEKSHPMENGALAQSKGINRAKVSSTSPRPVPVRPVIRRG